MSIELLCIKTHSQGVVISGQVYQGYSSLRCPYCNYLAYNIGLKSRNSYSECICNGFHLNEGIYWIGCDLLKEIGSQETEWESAQRELVTEI